RLYASAWAFASATFSNADRPRNSSRSRLWNDSTKPFSQGLAGATGNNSTPIVANQVANAEPMNSPPLSHRTARGRPRQPISRPNNRRTSDPLSVAAGTNTNTSRVYSSTTLSHLSDPPETVRL